jgi:micrococcal nuclease
MGAKPHRAAGAEELARSGACFGADVAPRARRRAAGWRTMGETRRIRGALAVGLAVALLFLVALAGCGSGGGSRLDAAALPRSVRAHVIRAVDGDTALVRVRGEVAYVRYIGVDTPETVKPGTPVQCYGPRAHAYDERLVAGRSVRLVFDAERQDVYGRLLAYVYAGRRFVNAALVRGGYARTLTIPPNTAHAALFTRLAQRAARRGRGLWARC